MRDIIYDPMLALFKIFSLAIRCLAFYWRELKWDFFHLIVNCGINDFVWMCMWILIWH